MQHPVSKPVPKPSSSGDVIGAQVLATATGLHLIGEIDYQNADTLREAGEQLLDAQHLTNCDVDLAGVVEPGTIVVALLLAWYRVLRRRSAQMRVLNVPASLQRVLQFTGVMNVLAIADAPPATSAAAPVPAEV